jgi:hypothetical protein
MIEINPMQQYMRMEKIQGKTSYLATSAASDNFANVLNNVVSREMVNGIKAKEEAARSTFLEKKIEIEQGVEEENEEDESIYKTVRKIETKIIKLARLERQMMAGF